MTSSRAAVTVAVVATSVAVAVSVPAAATAAPRHPRAALLRGNGVATTRFGQTEVATTRRLRRALGPPVQPVEAEPGSCTIDAVAIWPNKLDIFFDHGRFVGYAEWSQAPYVTARGIRVGDSLARARVVYGSALTTSTAQGGSWFVHTRQGTLDGLLSGELGQAAAPRLASIDAGSVGCPAMSP